MPTYTPPLRDMQFVMHELFNVVADFKAMPKHADIDADTINAVLKKLASSPLTSPCPSTSAATPKAANMTR